MRHIFTTQTWWIAYSDAKDIVHYGQNNSGQLDTGQPNLQLFYTEQQWLDRLLQFGIIPENQYEMEEFQIPQEE